MIRWLRLRRLIKAGERARHQSDDIDCIYWRGDFAGTDMLAFCPVCGAKA